MLADYRQILNNYLQEVYRDDPRRRLTWETSYEGPDNRPTWQAIAYLNKVEWGRGKGPSRGAAMEAAAERVLIELKLQSQEA
ncbi:hypothetical protein J3R83DRAFT_6204 [Lanmaoa asiatica]|nr:hypothetical protein J3R83DRAFT_6204 [Lanmaoa asiatica]